MSGFITVSPKARRLGLIVVEHVLIVLSVFLAAVIRFGVAEAFIPSIGALLWKSMVVATVLQISLHYCDLYDMRTLADRGGVFAGLLRGVGAASVVLAFLYYWVPTLVIGRGVFILSSVFILTLVIGWRLIFEWLLARGGPTERLLIVGTGGAAVTLARELFQRRGELGVELVGFVDSDPALVGVPLINPGVIGVVSDIPGIVRSKRVDRVVVSLADARGKLNMDELLKMKLNQGVRFDHLASVYEEYTGKIAVENLRPSWMIFSNGFRQSRRQAAAKRAFDVVGSLVGLIAAAPLMAVTACAIRLGSSGAVLYSQQRVGKDGAVFTIYKFRSMQENAEAVSGAVWASVDDPRVTPVGRVLRRTRIDELPQLWNVLVGDMSFVGPRPERPEFVSELTNSIPFYPQRHVVRPGITGWAQVRHRYGASVHDAQEKLQYELFYIKHMSTTFDVYILSETVKTVLVRAGS